MLSSLAMEVFKEHEIGANLQQYLHTHSRTYPLLKSDVTAADVRSLLCLTLPNATPSLVGRTTFASGPLNYLSIFVIVHPTAEHSETAGAYGLLCCGQRLHPRALSSQSNSHTTRGYGKERCSVWQESKGTAGE